MSTNIAVQRGRKAARRKQVLAERRKADDGHSPLAERIALAATAPIHTCRMPETFDKGMGTIVIARGFGSLLTVAFFLADTYALGVKDAFGRFLEEEELARSLDTMDSVNPMTDADPAYVRKFLGELVAWARDIGFEPAKKYEALDRIFGDVDAGANDATFTFGLEGRPVYMSGPTDTPAQVSQRMGVIAKYNQREGLSPPTTGEFEIKI